MKDWLSAMKPFKGKKIVIKYGGAAMQAIDNAEQPAKVQGLHQVLAEDLYRLQQAGVFVAVVHGGGPQIGQHLEKQGIQSQFIDGLRVTDERTFQILEMVLTGIINPSIVGALQCKQVFAVGLNGKDGALINATKKTDIQGLGLVGEVKSISSRLMNLLWQQNFFPIISPIGLDTNNGQAYNVNADTVASAIAIAVQADMLLSLSNVEGVRFQNETIPYLSPDEARKLVDLGIITTGMIPKVEGLIKAANSGVERVQLINGNTPNPILNGIEQNTGTRFK